MLPSLFLELAIVYLRSVETGTQEKFISNAEAYLEPVKYLRWNLLA